jgi:hypothetical protein
VGPHIFDQTLRFLSIVLAAAIVYRIIQQQLFTSPLSSFALMLGVVLARDAAVSIPKYDSHAYTLVWEVSLPVLLLAQVWAGLDTLRAIARLYVTFGDFIVRLYLCCLGASVVICSATLPWELSRVNGQEAALRELFLLQRCVDSLIAGTLILASAFLLRHLAPPRRPPRNLILHTLLLSLYFAGYSGLFFAENLAVLGGAATVERTQFVLIVLLYSAWACSLSSEGAPSEPWPKVDVVVLQPATLPLEDKSR